MRVVILLNYCVFTANVIELITNALAKGFGPSGVDSEDGRSRLAGPASVLMGNPSPGLRAKGQIPTQAKIGLEWGTHYLRPCLYWAGV